MEYIEGDNKRKKATNKQLNNVFSILNKFDRITTETDKNKNNIIFIYIGIIVLFDKKYSIKEVENRPQKISTEIGILSNIANIAQFPNRQ